MAERQRSTYGKPTFLPREYQVGRNAKWLESISRGRVASASEFGKTLKGRSPYIVVFSERQQQYIVFFNEVYGGFDPSTNQEISNQEIFMNDMREGREHFMDEDSPRRKKKMLSELKKTELQSICRKHRIRGYSKLNKSELVKLLSK